MKYYLKCYLQIVALIAWAICAFGTFFLFVLPKEFTNASNGIVILYYLAILFIWIPGIFLTADALSKWFDRS